MDGWDMERRRRRRSDFSYVDYNIYIYIYIKVNCHVLNTIVWSFEKNFSFHKITFCFLFLLSFKFTFFIYLLFEQINLFIKQSIRLNVTTKIIILFIYF